MVPDAVFASPFRDFALAYAGRKWSDRDFNQSIRRKSGQHEMIMREMRPNAIEDTYKNVPGYLYHLAPQEFERTQRPGSTWEVISTKPVKPLRVESVTDVLQALESEPSVRLERYDPGHPDTRAAIRRMVARMNEMEDPSEYRDWRLEGAPDEIRRLLEEEEARLKTAKAPVIQATSLDDLRDALQLEQDQWGDVVCPSPRDKVFVIKDNDGIVGSVRVNTKPRETWDDEADKVMSKLDPQVWVTSIVVRKDRRGEGVGTALQQSLQQKYDRIALGTGERSDESMKHLSKRLGFKKVLFRNTGDVKDVHFWERDKTASIIKRVLYSKLHAV